MCYIQLVCVELEAVSCVFRGGAGGRCPTFKCPWGTQIQKLTQFHLQYDITVTILQKNVNKWCKPQTKTDLRLPVKENEL